MELGIRKGILVEQEAKGVWDTGVEEIQEVGEKQERNIKCQLPLNDLFFSVLQHLTVWKMSTKQWADLPMAQDKK